MLESRTTNEMANIKSMADINRTNISYMQIEINEQDKKTKRLQDLVKSSAEEIYDYREKINKQMLIFESETQISLNNMRQAIERQQVTEDIFLTHVKHMEDELKRMDLQYETEKANTSKIIEQMNEKVNELQQNVKDSANDCKDYETKLRLFDEKFKLMRQDIEELKLEN